MGPLKLRVYNPFPGNDVKIDKNDPYRMKRTVKNFFKFFCIIRGKRGRRGVARIRYLPVRQSKSDSKMG